MNQLIEYASINETVQNGDEFNSLLDVSINHKIPHMHECGGHGNCTTCRVRVLDGIFNCSPKTELEKRAASTRNWDPSIRLACQTYPKGNVKLQRLIWSSAEINQLQKELVPEGKAEERPIAILFCDLRNFTRLSSQNLNFDIAFMLNRFYTALGEPILMNNGIIYQYVGDEIVGVFGTTGGTREKNCTDAIRAALGMQYALNILNKTELKDFDVTLKSGIGINFGRAYVGHLGHPTHRQFSIVGDPVNTASRIQSHTKKTDSKILLSKSVFESVVKDSLQINSIHQADLSGKENSVELYDLAGFKELDLQLELQESLHIMLQDELAFAQLFYDKVFRMAPQARSLFRSNMTDQGRLLTHMLGGIVYSLSRPEHLATGLKKLGQSHIKYGVQAAHYPIVKQAMMETIDETISDLKTDRTLEAWSTALDFVMDAMQNWENL